MIRRDADERSVRTLHRTVGRLEGELVGRPTGKDLDRLRDGQGAQARRVDAHDRAIRELTEQVGELATALREVRSRARADAGAATARITELTGTVTGQARRIERLHRELHRVEDALRAAAGVPLADLAPTGDDDDLAAAVRRGRRCARDRLDDVQRAGHEDAVAAPQRWERAHGEIVRAVVAASRAVAEAPPGRADAGAVARFREARDRLVVTRGQQGAVRSAAEASRAVLDADAERELLDAPVVAAGRRARDELTRTWRARLDTAVGAGHRLPPWFVAVLGSGPPPDAGPWYDAATALLVHRTVFGIGDPVAALGDGPGDGSDEEYAAEHAALARRLEPFGLP
ncbi:hypothetical protein [Pseudonocardia spirodelae]|uniref:Uncharacterized protein n=1 Tax=Pseudonocardia spirodelae TaxID=3133431 RepID=A0ABU8T7T4_9PSEU